MLKSINKLILPFASPLRALQYFTALKQIFRLFFSLNWISFFASLKRFFSGWLDKEQVEEISSWSCGEGNGNKSAVIIWWWRSSPILCVVFRDGFSLERMLRFMHSNAIFLALCLLSSTTELLVSWTTIFCHHHDSCRILSEIHRNEIWYLWITTGEDQKHEMWFASQFTMESFAKLITNPSAYDLCLG